MPLPILAGVRRKESRRTTNQFWQHPKLWDGSDEHRIGPSEPSSTAHSARRPRPVCPGSSAWRDVHLLFPTLDSLEGVHLYAPHTKPFGRSLGASCTIKVQVSANGPRGLGTLEAGFGWHHSGNTDRFGSDRRRNKHTGEQKAGDLHEHSRPPFVLAVVLSHR